MPCNGSNRAIDVSIGSTSPIGNPWATAGSRCASPRLGATSGRRRPRAVPGRQRVWRCVFAPDSKKLVFRVTFVDAPDTPPATPASGWERSRPNFFSLYRDRKYVASMAGLTHFEPQEVTIFNDRELAGAAEIQVLLPFYYRNAEVVVRAIGIDAARAIRASRAG